MQELPVDAIVILKFLAEAKNPFGEYERVPREAVPHDLLRADLLELIRSKGFVWLGRKWVNTTPADEPEANDDVPQVQRWIQETGDLDHVLLNDVPPPHQLHLMIRRGGIKALAIERELQPLIDPDSEAAKVLRKLLALKAFSAETAKTKGALRVGDRIERLVGGLKKSGLVESVKNRSSRGGYYLTPSGQIYVRDFLREPTR